MNQESLKIGKAIYSHLSSDATITETLGDRIYPIIVQNPDTPKPYAVFTRLDVKPGYTKDGLSEEEVRYSIMVVSDEYGEGCDIATDIRKSLEMKHGTIGGIRISDIRIDSVSEDYDYNSFLQTIDFIITL